MPVTTSQNAVRRIFGPRRDSSASPCLISCSASACCWILRSTRSPIRSRSTMGRPYRQRRCCRRMAGSLDGMAPLLAVDAPSLLFRAFYALPDSIGTARAIRSTPCWGPPTCCCSRSSASRPGRRSCASARRPRTTGPRPTRPTTPTGADVPDALTRQWSRAATSSAPSASRSPWPRAWRPMTCSAPTRPLEAEAGGEALLLTGDRDMFQCASDRVRVLYVKTGGSRGAEEMGPKEVSRALRRPAGGGSRLHRPARRPVRRAARRQGHRREDGGRPAAPARHAGGGARQRDPREAGRCARRCSPTPIFCSPSRTSRPCAMCRSSSHPTGPPTRRAPPRRRASWG